MSKLSTKELINSDSTLPEPQILQHNYMKSQFITNYTDSTFLTTIQANLRSCDAFCFSVSFIKKAGLVLLANDIESAIERGAKGRLITSSYQNFTDVESLRFFYKLSHSECGDS